MSDWQVGDLALCINDDPCPCGCYIAELRAGAVLRVCEILSHPLEGVGLCFDEIGTDAAHTAFNAVRFRKIRPDQHEACETEFVTLLKRSKQRVSA